MKLPVFLLAVSTAILTNPTRSANLFSGFAAGITEANEGVSGVGRGDGHGREGKSLLEYTVVGEQVCRQQRDRMRRGRAPPLTLSRAPVCCGFEVEVMARPMIFGGRRFYQIRPSTVNTAKLRKEVYSLFY